MIPVTVCYGYDPWQPMWFRTQGEWALVSEYEQRFDLPSDTSKFSLLWDGRQFSFDLINHHATQSNPLEWLDVDFWYQVGPEVNQTYHVGYELIQDGVVYREQEDKVYLLPEPPLLVFGVLALGCGRKRR